MRPSWLTGAWALARRKPLGTAGVAVLAALATAAVFADLIAVHDPVAQDIAARLQGPSSGAFFGTDTLGRDVFSRVVHGARISLYVGIVSVAIAVALGGAVGLVSGYAGGKLDLAIQRVVDALLAFPVLVLALVLVTALTPSTSSVIAAVAIAADAADGPAGPRRGPQGPRRALRHRRRGRGRGAAPHPPAPRASQRRGAHGGARRLAPRASDRGRGVAELPGAGAPPPDPSWGRMLREGTGGFLEAAPWLTLFPAAALTLAVFSFAVIGDAARDILDPRFWSRRS